jgi:hypothetical protein
MGSALLSVVAVAALTLSVAAYRSSRQALRSARPARMPSLRLCALDGHARRSLADDTREYAILVELVNDTTRTVAITNVALRVTYRTRANFLGAVDLGTAAGVAESVAGRPLLMLPVPLAPAAKVTGWILFSTANVIPRHCRVQDYTLVALDATGSRTLADASLPPLLAADTDGQGPATWGWD